MIKSLLVANRGEIAVRIIRACRSAGIRAVAVYSDADVNAYWTRLADAAVPIGPAPSRLSYLNIEAIISAARDSGVDAVHPGYGFLSESAPFAQAVGNAGLTFIGPRPETIALMGDKVAARKAAIASDVPVLPGSDGPVADADAALSISATLGWPIAVKASFGGGGRGLRVAKSPEELANALADAGREAQAAFGRGEVFLERYLDRPRHVEVQIIGDSHGNVVAVGDRDCSVQRRHQKLLEEAPAANLSDQLRARMHEDALRLCRDIGYEGTGTVEFLVDRGGREYFFLEMNTRLQVEHGVTELVTGIDLVQEQIAIAAGEPLSFLQSDVRIHGHAIQGRIVAEDPWEEFRAGPGRIDLLDLPAGPWARCDFGVQAGDEVPAHYDSLLGKVHCWGRTRDEARRRLASALEQTRIGGIPNTAPYLRELLDQPDFVLAQHDTGSLERDWMPDPASRPPAPIEVPPAQSPPTVIRRNAHAAVSNRTGAGTRTSAPTRPNANFAFSPRNATKGKSDLSTSGGGTVVAPTDGTVTIVNCAVGQIVRKSERLLLMEAMKMEAAIIAPSDGVVERIHVVTGDSVRSGDMLVTIEAGSGEEAGAL